MNRRRNWTGALSRLLRRSDVHNLSPALKSRITGFLESQFIWISTGCPRDTVEQMVNPLWSDIFQILNVDDRFLGYLLNTVSEQSDLTNLRLTISTASRVLRDPATQLKIIEASIHRAIDLGHGISLLHGTLFSLPIYFRNEYGDSCPEISSSLLCPLLLLQEQLSNCSLPLPSKVKLIQQNTHLISRIRLDSIQTYWKLVIYLHQLIRLTLSLYSTDDADKDAFGMLQVYIHNELKPLLNNLFEQRKKFDVSVDCRLQHKFALAYIPTACQGIFNLDYKHNVQLC